MFIIFMTAQETVSNYIAWPTEMATKNDQDLNLSHSHPHPLFLV